MTTRRSSQHTTQRLQLTLLCFLGLSGCDNDGGGVCTEASCNSTLAVSYGSLAISGPYELFIDLQRGGRFEARCNDPSSAESADNPDGLECNGRGFTMEGDAVSSPGSVRVTAMRVEDGELLISNIEAPLTEDPEPNLPNGPGCDPECFDWSGTLRSPDE